MRGKPRGKRYQAILRELAALDAAPDASTHEQLTSWQQVRARDAQSFVRQGGQLGAEVRHAPQAIWLDTDPAAARRGLCTGLALAWALEPGAATLLDNLFSTAAHPTDPAARQFRQAIEQLHQAANLGAAGAPLAAITNWDQAVDHLAAQSGERALLIHVGNHSVALAARPEVHATQFAFFDPNAGVWHRITDPARLKAALNSHFTPERLQQYASDGQISAIEVQTPAAASQPAWQRARTPLELTVTRLIRQDQQQGALLIGARRVSRAELYRLGATRHGHTSQPDTDWSDPAALRLPARSTAGQRTLLVSGSGLRLYGAWRTLSGAMDNHHQGRMRDAAIDLGGFAAEFAGEATEHGAARLGDFLQHTLDAPHHRRPRRTGTGAQQTRADDQQDALFQGGMATAGALTGLSLAIAAAAGASSALLGPIGLGLGVALLAAGQIYAAAGPASARSRPWPNSLQWPAQWPVPSCFEENSQAIAYFSFLARAGIEYTAVALRRTVSRFVKRAWCGSNRETRCHLLWAYLHAAAARYPLA